MSSDNVNNSNTSSHPKLRDLTKDIDPEDLDERSPAHRAIEAMMAMFNVISDFENTHDFIDLCVDLEMSPAFRTFATRNHVDKTTAAKLLLAGGFYYQFVPRDIPVEVLK